MCPPNFRCVQGACVAIESTSPVRPLLVTTVAPPPTSSTLPPRGSLLPFIDTVAPPPPAPMLRSQILPRSVLLPRVVASAPPPAAPATAAITAPTFTYRPPRADPSDEAQAEDQHKIAATGPAPSAGGAVALPLLGLVALFLFR